MAARAWGTVSSTSRFHFRVKWGGQRTKIRRKRVGGWAAGAGADEGLARAHFANQDGTPVGLEGQHCALDGVLLAPHRGAQQPGQLEAVLRGPVQGRVGLHHSLGDGFLEGVGLSYRLRVRVY